MNMETLVKLKPKTKTLKKVVVIDTEEPVPGVEDLDAFISPSISSKFSVADFPIRKVNAKDQLAFILFSSGTTGLPKAVALTHYGVSGTLIGLNHPDLVLPIEPDVGLGVLPFFHIYGLYVILQTIIKKKPLMILEHFNPFDYLRCIEKYKIDVVIGVPMLIQFLAKSPVVDDYDLSCVKEATCASAPIGEDTIQELKDRLKLQNVRQAYGCTEAHMLVTISPAVGARPGSVGKVAPGMKMFIRDVKTGESLPAFKEGEICSISDMVMKGYYRNDAATKETFTEDGWLKSGDIGYYDEDGQLYIVDRMKELIKYKGFQVAPAELEAVLMKNKKIADAGVIGKPDKVAGEVPVAFVVKQEDVDLTETEVKNYVAGFLTQRKHLHEVYFVDEIPRTRSGKIMRRELKKILENMMKSKL
ncbi:luciferin 4-monooxygenase-like [Onthophagus taurus]|uniref:luciferin 4-monooxygenase-like n=1 Tax=Onthophagus taurus TaxID=166361 RepID=UPI0039BE5647